MVAILGMNSAIDVRPVLPVISVPTLVVHSVGDPIVPVDCGRYLAEHIAGARYIELPGDDHLTIRDDGSGALADIEEFLTGHRPEPNADRVLATVMFSDIVGSTAQAADLGDRRWKALLDRHDATVDQVLAAHRGRKVNSTGDGMLATFDGPARAIRCACALHDALHAVGVTIRVGLHTGEIELRGDDIGGIAVHISARVAATAQPDEVLVSRTVVDLVAGSDICFDDRGTHTLKGVPGEWQLFAVDT